MNHRSITPSTNNSLPDDSKLSATSMIQVAGVGAGTVNVNKTIVTKTAPPHDPLTERSRRLAKELEEFVERGMQGILATERGDAGAPSIDAATELQIQIARMFRQVCMNLCMYVYPYESSTVPRLCIALGSEVNEPKVMHSIYTTMHTILIIRWIASILFMNVFEKSSNG